MLEYWRTQRLEQPLQIKLTLLLALANMPMLLGVISHSITVLPITAMVPVEGPVFILMVNLVVKRIKELEGNHYLA